MISYLASELVYVPDEKGELTALDASSALDSAASQMPPGDYGAAIGKMFLTLVALVLLLVVTFWFVRRLIQQRLQKGVGSQSIQILEKRMISPKTMLYLIEAEGKQILIAESQLEVKRLESFPASSPEENA